MQITIIFLLLGAISVMYLILKIKNAHLRNAEEAIQNEKRLRFAAEGQKQQMASKIQGYETLLLEKDQQLKELSSRDALSSTA